MAPLLTAQPFKAIYSTLIVLTVPARATYFYLKYLVKPLHPEWNARMSLLSALLHLFFHYCTVTRSRHVLEHVRRPLRLCFYPVYQACLWLPACYAGPKPRTSRMLAYSR